MHIRVGGGVHGGGDQIPKAGNAQRPLGDQADIVGGGIVILAVQTVGIGKMGIHRTDLTGLLVHQLAEISNAAAAKIVRHDVGRFVGRLQRHAVQQVLHGKGLAALDIAVRNGDPLKFVPDVGGGGDIGVGGVGTHFQRQRHGHHFGDGSRRAALIGVFLKDHRSGVQIDHIDCLGSFLKVWGILGGIGGAAAKEQGQNHQKRQRDR